MLMVRTQFRLNVLNAVIQYNSLYKIQYNSGKETSPGPIDEIYAEEIDVYSADIRKANNVVIIMWNLKQPYDAMMARCRVVDC